MKRIFIIAAFAGILMGCAATKQAISDYQTGANTPLAVNEQSPAQEAAPITSVVSALPFVGPFAGVIGTILIGFFTYRMGVAIRKNNNLVPATTVSSSNVATAILQAAANIFTGMFTTASQVAPTTTGSVFQRVWKTALATVGAGITAALAVPSLATYLTGHPLADTILVFLSSGIMGIEKYLSSIQPIATASASSVAAV